MRARRRRAGHVVSATSVPASSVGKSSGQWQVDHGTDAPVRRRGPRRLGETPASCDRCRRGLDGESLGHFSRGRTPSWRHAIGMAMARRTADRVGQRRSGRSRTREEGRVVGRQVADEDGPASGVGSATSTMPGRAVRARARASAVSTRSRRPTRTSVKRVPCSSTESAGPDRGYAAACSPRSDRNRGEIAVGVIRGARDGRADRAVYPSSTGRAARATAGRAYSWEGRPSKIDITPQRYRDHERSGDEACSRTGFQREHRLARAITAWASRSSGRAEAIEGMGDKCRRASRRRRGCRWREGDDEFLSSADEVIALGARTGGRSHQGRVGGGGRGMGCASSEARRIGVESAQRRREGLREGRCYVGAVHDVARQSDAGVLRHVGNAVGLGERMTRSSGTEADRGVRAPSFPDAVRQEWARRA